LNLYSFSIQNNIDFGILYESKLVDKLLSMNYTAVMSLLNEVSSRTAARK